MSLGPLFLCLLAAFFSSNTLSAAIADVPTARERLERLPTENPYVTLLMRVESLAPEARDSLIKWTREAERTSVLPNDGANRAFMQSVVEEFLQMPELRPGQILWRIRENSPETDAIPSPPFSPIQQISKLVALGIRVETAPKSARLSVKLMEFGRGFRVVSESLLDQMIGVVIEDQARKEVAARLSDYSAVELRGLLRDSAALPSALDAPGAFDGEFAMVAVSLRRDFLPLFEKLWREGSATNEKRSAFTRHLRIGGLITLDDSEQTWVTFEDVERKRSFRLREEESYDGLTLVSVDVLKKQAVLRHSEGDAVLDLDSRTITEHSSAFVELVSRWEKIGAFESDFDALAHATKTRAKLLANPGGPEAYVQAFLTAQREAFAYAFQAARTARLQDQSTWPGLSEGDPGILHVYPAYAKIARQMLEKALQAEMLKIAIELRLAMSEGRSLQVPADPWSDSRQPFEYQSNAAGGFMLQSAFENQSGERLSCLFGGRAEPAR